MPFERSLEIERRLDDVLRLIRTGRYSTPMLSEKVGVSIPTISRCVTALRDRGYDIQSARDTEGWFYVLRTKLKTDNQLRNPEHLLPVEGHAEARQPT
jgi:biotin operon repressor